MLQHVPADFLRLKKFFGAAFFTKKGGTKNVCYFKENF
jgi:hypothetical protein